MHKIGKSDIWRVASAYLGKITDFESATPTIFSFSNFFRVYSRMCYHVMFFPWKIEEDDNCKSYMAVCTYRTRSNKFRNGACGAVYLLTLIKFGAFFVIDASQEFGANPVNYLYLLRSFGSLWNYVTLTYFVFFKFPSILPPIIQHCNIMENKAMWKLDGKLKMICSSQVVFAVTSMYMIGFFLEFTMVALPETRMQFFNTQFYKNTISLITSEVIQSPEESGNANDLNSPGAMDIFLGSLDIFATFCTAWVPYCGDWLILIVGIALWAPCHHFNKIIENDLNSARNSFKTSEILEMYDDLKNLSVHINSAFSAVLLPYSADCLFYYATHLMDIVMDQAVVTKVFLIVSICVIGCSLVLAADGCENVQILRRWLSQPEVQHDLKSEPLRFTSLTQELSSDPIGLRGAGMFTLNYSFVFSVLNTILTIFILCVQFQFTAKRNNKD